MCSAVNEDTPGALQSFVVDSNGMLTPSIATVNSGGDAPAFTAPLSSGQVAIMNVSYIMQFIAFSHS